MAYRKSKRRNKDQSRREKRRKQPVGVVSGSHQLKEISSVFDVFDDILGPYDAESQDLDVYLQTRLVETIQDIQQAVQNCDPARVIAALRIRAYMSIFFQRNSEDEEDWDDIEVSISLVDAASLILYSGSELKSEQEYPAISIGEGGMGEIVEQLIPKLQKIRILSFLIGSANQLGGKDPQWLNQKHLSSLQWIRESTYSKFQIDIYDDLFGDPEIGALVEDLRGYSYSELRALCLWSTGLAERLLNRSRDESADLLCNSENIDKGVQEEIEKSITRMFAPRLNDVTFSAEFAAREAKISIESARKILDDFSIDLTGIPHSELPTIFSQGENPLQSTPFVRERNSRFFLINESLAITAIKANLEKLLSKSELYLRRRGEMLEEWLKNELVEYFGAQHVDTGVKYSDSSGTRGETDALVVIGDVAIIFEAKASTIYEPGAAMPTGRFVRKMRSNIHKASVQLEKLRSFIETERFIPVEKEDPMDLSHIQEIHTVIVTLEDLMGLSTSPMELEKSRFLENDRSIPWIVSVNDLRLVLELADNPAEFLVYLRRRRNPLIAKKYLTVDELDLFFYFRQSGLWIENEEEASIPTYIPTLTAELDEWHLGGGAEKPTIKDTSLLKYVRQAYEKNVEHWFEFGAALLEMSESAQDDLQGNIDEILRRTKNDGFPHSFTAGLDLGKFVGERTLLIFVATVAAIGEEGERNLERHLSIRRKELGYQRAFACILNGSGNVSSLKYSSTVS